MPTIQQYPDCRLRDVGCGWDYLRLKTVELFIKSDIGIDFKVQESQINKIKTIRMKMTDFLPFESESFDIVTMLAVLEHLSNPLSMMKET